MLRDASEAQDAVHDAAVIAWTRFDELRDRSRFDAWFDRIVVNACRQRLRRVASGRSPRGRRAGLPLADGASGRAERDALRRALDRLTPEHRPVVVLRHLEGYSIARDRGADRRARGHGQVATPLRAAGAARRLRRRGARDGDPPMSDERFDDDLRSVLLEDAPRDVPDDLRHRVAAIPLTHPVEVHGSVRPRCRRSVRAGPLRWRQSPSSWRSRFSDPVPRSGAGRGRRIRSRSPLAVPVLVLVLGAIAEAFLRFPGDLGACRVADIAGEILGWQGAAGSRIADLEITNTSPEPITLRGHARTAAPRRGPVES